MHLQKGLVDLRAKMFLPPLLYFWSYNPSPNVKIIFLVGSRAHLETQLLTAEWHKVLKFIHCRISLTKEEVKLLSYILSFLVFVAGAQSMKTLVKVSMNVQRIAGALSRMSI